MVYRLLIILINTRCSVVNRDEAYFSSLGRISKFYQASRKKNISIYLNLYKSFFFISIKLLLSITSGCHIPARKISGLKSGIELGDSANPIRNKTVEKIVKYTFLQNLHH